MALEETFNFVGDPFLKEDHGLSNVHRSADSKADEEKNHSQEDPQKDDKMVAVKGGRPDTRMILERLKAAQAAQKLEEILLADPQITQYMLDWRTEIRERDLEVWGPLTQDEEALLNPLEEYLV